jgi:hypothetical protein
MTPTLVALDSALSRFGWIRTVSAIGVTIPCVQPACAGCHAGVAELEYARGLGPRGRETLGVRVPPPALRSMLRGLVLPWVRARGPGVEGVGARRGGAPAWARPTWPGIPFVKRWEHASSACRRSARSAPDRRAWRGTGRPRGPWSRRGVRVVLRGRASFELDGQELDAPAGTFVLVSDPSVYRRAVAAEPDTAVLALGGPPTFQPSASEWIEWARPHLRSDPARARWILDELGAARPDSVGVRIGDALFAVAQGNLAVAREELAAVLEEEPSLRVAPRAGPRPRPTS